MIKINKVDSLDKRQGKVMYKDLEENELFIMDCWSHHGPYYKVEGGYVRIENGKYYKDDGDPEDRLCTLVDAEINWAYKDGE